MAVPKYIVYTITNTVNEKVYVGITNNYKHRINIHIGSLNRNDHGNIYLQREYNKYGREAFAFDVVSEFDDKYEASRCEKYFTDCIFMLNKSICYNIISGGIDATENARQVYLKKLRDNPDELEKVRQRFIKVNLGKPASQEKRDKIRDAHIGKKASSATKLKMSMARKGSGNPKAKSVIDIETGEIYGCLKDACKHHNLNYDAMRARINGYNKSKSIFKWL